MHDDGEATIDLLRRGLAEFGLEASALWAVLRRKITECPEPRGEFRLA